jgi:hypothetical protein
MQRGLVAFASGFVVAGLALAWPASSFGAAQVKLGKSGYSGTLSSDPITRQQQLLCDPDAEFDPDATLTSGSMSTYYDAGVVTLMSLAGAPGWIAHGYVQVQDSEGAKSLITISLYQTGDFNGTETGDLQVFFERATTPPPPSVDGPIFTLAATAPPPTYTFEDHDGTNGDITHELLFKYKSVDTPLDTVVQYTNFADFGPDGGGRDQPHNGSAPDSLTFHSATLGDVVYTADQINSATVSGDLVPNAAPLPSAAWGGLALLGVMGLARLRRGAAVTA